MLGYVCTPSTAFFERVLIIIKTSKGIVVATFLSQSPLDNFVDGKLLTASVKMS